MSNQNIKTPIYIEGVKDFLLSQTLECGQCFHYIKVDEEEYKISAYGRMLHIKQTGDTLILYNASAEDYERIWKKYFDLDRDYGRIKSILLENNPVLEPAIEEMWGVRILNQDFFETLISFIISQNQQIPRIRKIISEICKKYGEKLDDELYSFPGPKEILAAGEEGMRECKAGFRAAYIINACKWYLSRNDWGKYLLEIPYTECIDNLCRIKGVGNKVANCVALFSLEKRDAFPVDVWIKRIMEELYFDGETRIGDIEKLAHDKYGEYGGYAQQYLFYYGKTNEIGKKIKK